MSLPSFSSSLHADLDRSQPPAPGPAPEVSFPDYRTFTLANGLKVFVVESQRAPVVTFRLVVKAGDAADGGKVGLAEATASQLNRGTAGRSATQFAQEVDEIGASVEAGTNEDATYVSAHGLTKFLPQVLDLFADAVRRPVFPEAELAKYRRRALSRLAQERQQPGSLANRLRGQLVYGLHHPYGTYPTEASLGGLRREDLVGFHHAHFLPNDATLAVVGDVRADDLRPEIERAFGDWTRGTVPSVDYPALPKVSGVSVHLVDRPGSVQSTVVLSAPALARNDAAWPDLNVVNSVLGGGFSGRLFQNLRERHGYTYGSSSNYGANLRAGHFSASAEVRNEVTLAAVEEIRHEFGRIRDEPVPEKELVMQRRYLTGNYLLSLENPTRTAERVQEIDLFGLRPDYFRSYVQRIDAVDAAEAQSLARRFVPSPDNLLVIVVGDAAQVRPQLEKLGPVTVYDQDLKLVAPAAPASSPAAAAGAAGME